MSFVPRVLLVVAAVAALSSAPEFAVAQQAGPQFYAEMRWRMIGPFRGGRTVAVSGVPEQPNVFYMAANNGGVWKSTDYGQVWIPIFDQQPTGSVGALAVAPSDASVIYVGSGEGLRRPDLSVGKGIYKSTDAGRSWEHLGLSDGQQIAAIAIDPHDPNRVFVAVLGHPYGPNAGRGLYRSLDGGHTWDKVLYKDENTGAIDVALDPVNPQTVYAALWASRRPPWTSLDEYEAPGSGLYKSTDGGTHWQQLTQGLPGEADGVGRIGIGIAASNPSHIYALVDAPKLGGLYRSADAGASWKRINIDERIWGRGSDFACVRVDPRHSDTVYVANISTYRSTDGGATFTAIKGAPGGDDYHSIWINPENPQIILLGSDQGATLSINGGQTWSSWYNQPTAQFYHVITDNQFPYWVYGGQQESGSAGTASRGDSGEITFREWYPVGTEEYGYVAPDPLHPDFIFGGKVTRFDRRTRQTEDVSPVPLRTGKYRFNRTAPLLFSQADPHALYLGSNVLFKTTDGGKNWRVVSPDLTREDPGVPLNLGPFANGQHGKHRGVIYSIGPSPRDADLIWIGTDDGLIQVTRDGGKSWQNMTPPELTPWSKVAQLDASHFDPQTVYAAVNRFRLDDLRPYIYRTHDGGRSWRNIVAGLPADEPVNTVREDPVRRGLLFAGTERSIYMSLDDGEHWQSLQLNLPPTSMRDLVIHGDDVVVGTHGRSFWILDDITSLRQMSSEVMEAPAHLFEPQMSYRIRRSLNTDTPLPPEVPAGQNPPDGAILDYLLKSDAGPVMLEILDAGGKLVRRYSSQDKPEEVDPNDINIPTYWVRPPRTLSAAAGMHRWVWDLHYPPPHALEREFPISAVAHDTPRAPQGPRALPGHYTIRLTAAGKTYEQSLTLKMDPRVKTSPGDLEQQFEYESRISDALAADFEALQQVNKLRAQLQGLRAHQNPEAAALDDKLSALAGSTGGYGAVFLSGKGGAGLARLNAGLSYIYEVVDSADAAPTAAAIAAFEELKRALDAQIAAWHEIANRDLPQLNQRLRRSNLPAVEIPPARQ